jgi:hypothetical protein
MDGCGGREWFLLEELRGSFCDLSFRKGWQSRLFRIFLTFHMHYWEVPGLARLLLSSSLFFFSLKTSNSDITFFQTAHTSMKIAFFYTQKPNAILVLYPIITTPNAI